MSSMIYNDLRSLALRLRKWICLPPYSGVPWIVWLYIAVSCACYTQNGPLSGHLFGFDDHVRMTQVLNWINGAGWYDRTIMRADPPEGFHTIWTRIVDIPIALVVLIAQQFVSQENAALVASVVVPYVEQVLLFIVARYFARPLVGKKDAWLVILFVMFSSVVNFKYTFAGFQAGEASHHSWYAILDTLMFGAAIRILLGVPGRAPVLLLALAIGLLLAVGIEGFMLMAMTAMIIGLLGWWFHCPDRIWRGAQAYGLGALFGLLLLPMNQPPSHFFDISFAEPSIIGPIMLGAAATFLALERFILTSIGRRDKGTSAIALIAVASILGGALAFAFPQILDGPAAALSPQERALAFSEHTEAIPMYRVAHNLIDYIGLIMPTVIALGAALFACWHVKGQRRRMMYLAYGGLAFGCGAIPQLIWRFYHYAMLTACPWLLWAWKRIGQALPRNRNYTLVMFGAFVALGPFWMLFLPAFNNNDPVTSRVLLYPAALPSTEDPCEMLPLAHYINEHYAPDTIISVPAWDTSKFLYYTKIAIDFVANYPSHNRFIANKRMFETRDAEEARDVVRQHHISLIAACRVPMFIDARFPLDRQRFIGLLQAQLPPPWLKQVDTGWNGNYLLYQVDPQMLAK